MTDKFDAELSALCARELVAARRDPERFANMTESLINSLATTIAFSCGGDQETVAKLLEGVTAHLFEATSDKATGAKIIPGITRRS